MGNTNIEDNIINAMSIFVGKGLEEAKFDKTIQALVEQCEDATLGKYRVKYQNSSFYAYSSPQIKYPKNSLVYVQIPQNDFSAHKTIIGAYKKQGTNFVVAPEKDEPYTKTGEDCVTDVQSSIGISSFNGFKTRYFKTIYNADRSSQSFLTIDQTRLKEDLKLSKQLICVAKIRTNLPKKNQLQGNYGIVITVQMQPRSKKNTKQIQTCRLEAYKDMTGNPYNYGTATRQAKVFKIDGQQFIRIQKIELFVEKFLYNGGSAEQAKAQEKRTKDIFLEDFELYGANELSEDELKTNVLVLEPSRAVFDSDGNLTLKATVKCKGKPITSDQDVKYYWCKEDALVQQQSDFYLPDAGVGWKCLNQINEKNEDERGWIPASNIFNLVSKKKDKNGKLKDNLEYSYKTKILCIAKFSEDQVLKKQLIVTNPDGQQITIISDSGTSFYYDSGEPTLTCLVNSIEETGDEYEYIWSMEKNDGTILNLLDQQASQHDKYVADLESLEEKISQLEEKISKKEVIETVADRQMAKYMVQKEDLLTKISSDTVEILGAAIVKNKILKIPVSYIVDKITFKCAVKQNGQYVGVAAIVLTNSLQQNEGYHLVINNGVQSFKYNEMGVSPTHKSVTNPLTLLPLKFTLYDPQNRAVVTSETVSSISNVSFKWKIPKVNTMINYSNSNAVENDNNIEDFTNSSLKYTIKDKYEISYKNNDIYLTLNYEGMTFLAQTDFTFIKQGQLGTNGTEYSSKIEPSYRNNIIPYYPTIYLKKNTYKQGVPYVPYKTNWGNNTIVKQNDTYRVYFKLKIFHNNNLVYETGGSTGLIKDEDVTWEVVKNKYASGIEDLQWLKHIEGGTTPTGEPFEVCYTYDDKKRSPACIVKASFEYNGVAQYSYLPIIFSLNMEGYEATLKEHTGFNYVVYTPDGRSPSYDDAQPHTLQVLQNINNIQQDVSNTELEDYKLTYDWDVGGTTGEKKGTNFIWHNNIKNLKIVDETKHINTCQIKPNDDFSSRCLTNNIKCTIKQKEENGDNLKQVSIIYIPVHLMLNQHGNAKINGWDGNSIQIDTDGGVILSPLVGAGRKNKTSDNNGNTFTGVLIGQVQKNENNLSTNYNGLIGLSDGKVSIYLDAETGNATFGVIGQGQIKLVPDGTSTIANWKINPDFLSTGNKAFVGDGQRGAYLGSNGTFEFSSGKEDIAGNSIDQNYIRYNINKNDPNIRDLQIMGGTIRGGSIQISENRDFEDPSKLVFKANSDEIQFGNWKMNKNAGADSKNVNRDVFYYDNGGKNMGFDNSPVGFSGNPKTSRGLYFWAGFYNGESSISVDSGGCGFERNVVVKGDFRADGDAIFGGDGEGWVQFNGPENIWVDADRTLTDYINSLMPEEEEDEDEEENNEEE